MRFFMPRTGVASALFLILMACLVSLGTGCHKKTPEERYQEAMKLLQENQVPLGILKLKDLIAQSPDAPIIPEVRLTLAGVFLQYGRDENVQDAVDQLQKVIEEVGYGDQRGMSAMQGLIQIHLQKEDTSSALAVIDAAIEKTKSEPNINKQLVTDRATIQLTSKDEAVQKEGIDFLHMEMLEGDLPEFRGQARELLAEFYRRSGKFDESAELYQTYIDKFPEDAINPVLMMTKALDLQRGGKDKSETDALFDKGAELQKKRVEDELDLRQRAVRLNELAALCGAYGRTDEAEQYLRRIMKEEPMSKDAINAQFGIGGLYINSGQLDKAQELFEQIRRENPNTNISASADRYLNAIAQLAQKLANDADQGTSPTMTQTTPAAGEGAMAPQEPGAAVEVAPAEKSE